ncbi:hypothetical protein AB0I69_08865 [Streptomyces sp. NPDC050508]
MAVTPRADRLARGLLDRPCTRSAASPGANSPTGYARNSPTC